MGTEQKPRWIELAVSLEKACAEAVADWIMEQGSTGIAEEQDRDNPGRVILKGYLENGDEAADAVAQIRSCLERVPELFGCQLPCLQVNGLADEDWNKKWKSFFQPISITERLVIKPSWRDYHARPGEVIIELDPGMAFGTGTHPSTRMCLRAIDDLAARLLPGARLLDVGTGSGILAIAGAKLGFQDVVGTDIDHTAVRVARKNAEANRVGERIVFATDGLGKIAGVFELVVANILPHILIDLRDALIDHTAGRGYVVLSGILNEKAAPVQEAYAQKMGFVRRLEEEQWCCLIFERRHNVVQHEPAGD
ncbi:MAG: 50S ribosomal protein L11 methyltransferase [Deltaproteobacteria bacterium]|nr:50S ribosomal protein L11 methyltransferase [Deltaproteobacteria bacterium]